MRRRLVLTAIGSLAAVLAIVPAVESAAPRLATLYPPAVQRERPSRLRLLGEGISPEARLVLPFPAETHFDGGGAQQAFFRVRVPKQTPPGVYPMRVHTPRGVSNLRLFAVTTLPVVQAEEENGRYSGGRPLLASAQPIRWPCVIAGGRLSRDIDLYRFSVEADQRLLFVTETRRVGLTPDPILRLRDSGGRTLRYEHDTPGLRSDERIDQAFSEAGDYYVELQSTDVPGWNNHYLLKIGALDYVRAIFPLGGRRGETVELSVTDGDGTVSKIAARIPDDPHSDHWRLRLEDFPGSLCRPLAAGDLEEIAEPQAESSKGAEPIEVDWPATINGRIAAPGEEDRYRIAVEPGTRVRVRADAYRFGSALDGVLLVYDPKGKKLLATNDDRRSRGEPDPMLDFEVPTGADNVVVALRDTLGRGGDAFAYRLSIDRGGDDFYLWLGGAQSPYTPDGWFKTDASDTLNIPRGGEAKLTVSVRREGKRDDPHYRGPVQGFAGPIRLRAVGLPAGVTAADAEIPADTTSGELVFRATDEAPREPFEVVVLGEATREDGTTIRCVAERKLYLSDPQMTHLPWNWRVQKLVCATTETAEEENDARP